MVGDEDVIRTLKLQELRRTLRCGDLTVNLKTIGFNHCTKYVFIFVVVVVKSLNSYSLITPILFLGYSYRVTEKVLEI